MIRMAYDGARHHVLMFGGGIADWFVPSNELYEWDGDAGRWNRLTPDPLPAAWPEVRGGHAMAWDERRRKLVVFGGYDANEPTLSLTPKADLWELDSETLAWQNRTPQPLPAAWPSARYFHQLVYDSGRDRTILFAGSNENPQVLADLWEWDGASGTWTDRTPSPLPAAWPVARYDQAMIYDSRRQRTVVFGGYIHGPLANDLWEWDGSRFLDRTPNPLPAQWPAPRAEIGFVYDALHDQMVLYGGYHPIFGDTWLWSGGTNTWTEESATGPSPRRGPAMAFDRARHRIVLFGGSDVDLAPPLHDTWEYDVGGAPPDAAVR
jgi:hypothetical protein